jgi:hypothetical protein
MQRNQQVTDYIEALSSPRREICARLREIFADSRPEIQEGYKWSRPVYTLAGKPVGYIVANKADVNLGFDHGAELNDPQGRLQGGGKQMRHIKFRSADEIDDAYVRSLLDQAVSIVNG